MSVSRVGNEWRLWIEPRGTPQLAIDVGNEQARILDEHNVTHSRG